MEIWGLLASLRSKKPTHLSCAIFTKDFANQSLHLLMEKVSSFVILKRSYNHEPIYLYIYGLGNANAN